MSMLELTIPYPKDLLLSLKESPEEFKAEARLLLAVKLYELGKVSTGRAAELAGMSRVEFFFALNRFGLSPIGVDPDEWSATWPMPETAGIRLGNELVRRVLELAGE